MNGAMSALRIAWRLPPLVAHVLLGAGITAALRVWAGPRWYLGPRARVVCWWNRVLARLLGLTVQRRGQPAAAPGVYVANHISWLDIVAISSVLPVSFVAKAELRRWPVIGLLTRWTGAAFVRRGGVAGLAETLGEVEALLHRGRSVVLFPEGTTTRGESVGRFHAALLEAPLRAGCPVRAISLRYRQGGAIDTLAPYVDDDHFVAHLLAILARPRTRLLMGIHALPVDAPGRRQALAGAAREVILGALSASDAEPAGNSPPPLPARAATVGAVE